MSEPTTHSDTELYAAWCRGYELREAINKAYTILSSGNPPWSAREANARSALRHAGAKIIALTPESKR